MMSRIKKREMSFKLYDVDFEHPETKTRDFLDHWIVAKNKEDAIEIAEGRLSWDDPIRKTAPKIAKIVTKVKVVWKSDYLGNNSKFYIDGQELDFEESELNNFDYLVHKFCKKNL